MSSNKKKIPSYDYIEYYGRIIECDTRDYNSIIDSHPFQDIGCIVELKKTNLNKRSFIVGFKNGETHTNRQLTIKDKDKWVHVGFYNDVDDFSCEEEKLNKRVQEKKAKLDKEINDHVLDEREKLVPITAHFVIQSTDKRKELVDTTCYD